MRKEIESVLALLIIPLLVCIISCDIRGKGKIYGDLGIRNQDVYLLKYSEELLREHEKLRADCLKKIAEKKKAFKDDLSASRYFKSNKLAEMTIETDGEKLLRTIDECSIQRYNLFFPHIITTVKTDDKGLFQFVDVSYGKYIIGAHDFKKWWFIPIELKSENQHLDLTATYFDITL